MQKIGLVVLLTAFFTTTGAGCTSNVPDVDCATTTVPSYAEMSVWSNCTPCHRSYGSYDSAASQADDAQQAVADGDMPRGRYELTADEEDSLYAWAQCGTPR